MDDFTSPTQHRFRSGQDRIAADDRQAMSDPVWKSEVNLRIWPTSLRSNESTGRSATQDFRGDKGGDNTAIAGALTTGQITEGP